MKASHLHFFLSLFFLFLILASCDKIREKQNLVSSLPVIERDLNEIRETGKLKVMTTYSSTSYFLYRGRPMGFEYELLKRFADHLDLELEIFIADNLDSLFTDLNQGKVDLVAHGMTITSERKKIISFTDYLYLTHQVLVQRKPDNWRKMKWSRLQSYLVHDAIELIGDTVSVRQNSSYIQRLENLSREIGGRIIIDTLPGNLSTDEIIQMVVDKKIKYTVADNNLASINASYYPVLNIEVPISFSQRIGWAVRNDSPQLLKEINNWLENMKDEVDYYVIYNKYFKNKRDFRKRIQSDFYSLSNNKISQYDDIIKENAERLGWDWRFLASMIYQESRFNPKASSWAGAKGLMQLMPSTAKSLGVKNRANPQQNINGGVDYLSQLWDKFDEIEDSIQRLKFTLASYNCGFYHVVDAQNLAEKRNLNKYSWDENVEKMILELSYPKNYNNPVVKYGYVRGIEPFTYVEQIFTRYNHYLKFIQ